MNLHSAKTLAIELMTKHKLYDMGYRFLFNQSKYSAGYCKYNSRKIELSQPLTEQSNDLDVRDTILHEIAHALVGSGHGHDAVWRRKALEIGCNGKRCYGGDNKDSTDAAYKMLAKYKGTCVGGHDHYRNRKPTVKQSCHSCCKRYNEKFLITWELAQPFQTASVR